MFEDFKPVLKIFIRFIVIYLLLLGGYQLYLNAYEGTGLDPISQWIGLQSVSLQNFVGYESRFVSDIKNDYSWFYVEGDYRSIMVEGCNAISVMILFSAFVFAFYKGKKTFVFAGLGLLFLLVTNIVRIAGLNVVFVDYPEFSTEAHDYLFPAIIYGSVVLLWLVWIKLYAIKNDENP